LSKQHTLRGWLQSAPFTLTMSSGFFSFFAHCGMLSALEDANLLPRRITGSSAGALVGVLFAAGCGTQKMKMAMFDLVKKDFWDPRFGLGLLRGDKFRALMLEQVDITLLEECLIPVTVSVYDGLARQTRILDKGPLDMAIYASSAVPFLFQPGRISGRLCWDGGIADRHGFAGLASDERVFYHHIMSRSPWRGKNSAAMQVPERDGLTALLIEGLPRTGPRKLHLGPAAYGAARQATIRALDLPLDDGCIRIQQ